MGVLNIQSQFSVSEMEKVRQRPLSHEMAQLPSRDELEWVVSKLKNGKAGGSSGILPEMIKAGCWADAVLIPIPKKGDLTRCDNLRGIALLDVVGKVVTRVLQERLQVLAEKEQPESQCGLGGGGGVDVLI